MNKPMKWGICGFCFEEIIVTSPDDGIVMNHRTKDKFVHESCYRKRFGKLKFPFEAIRMGNKPARKIRKNRRKSLDKGV